MFSLFFSPLFPPPQVWDLWQSCHWRAVEDSLLSLSYQLTQVPPTSPSPHHNLPIYHTHTYRPARIKNNWLRNFKNSYHLKLSTHLCQYLQFALRGRFEPVVVCTAEVLCFLFFLRICDGFRLLSVPRRPAGHGRGGLSGETVDHSRGRSQRKSDHTHLHTLSYGGITGILFVQKFFGVIYQNFVGNQQNF